MFGRYFADGNIYVTTAAPPAAGDAFNGGFRYNALGALYVSTTVDATDVYLAGKRVSTLGALIVGNTPPAVQRGWLAGHIFSLINFILGRQLNQTPAATEPFINGLRIGPNGGAYMQTTGTPVTP